MTTLERKLVAQLEGRDDEAGARLVTEPRDTLLVEPVQTDQDFQSVVPGYINNAQSTKEFCEFGDVLSLSLPPKLPPIPRGSGDPELAKVYAANGRLNARRSDLEKEKVCTPQFILLLILVILVVIFMSMYYITHIKYVNIDLGFMRIDQ